MTSPSHSSRPQRRSEEGFSLVELMVTVMIMSVVSAILFDFLTQTTVLTSRATNDVGAEQAATLALRTMTEDIRSASGLTACSAVSYATCLTFNVPRATSSGTNCPERQITYTLSGSTVKETRLDYPSACGTPTTTFTNKTIITNVQNGSSTALFTYYDKNQNAIDPVASASSIPKAATIVIALNLSYTGGGSTVLNLSSTAALRNNR